MTQQPKALRLADSIEREHRYLAVTLSEYTATEISAELHRLYAVNKKLIDTLEEIRDNSPDPTDRSFAQYVLKKVEEL